MKTILNAVVTISGIYFLLTCIVVFVMACLHKKRRPLWIYYSGAIAGVISGVFRFFVSGSDFLDASIVMIVLALLHGLRGLLENVKNNRKPKVQPGMTLGAATKSIENSVIKKDDEY